MYFELYDKNLELQRSHNALEQRIKELTTRLTRIQHDVKSERRMAEDYTGEDFKSRLININD